MGACHCKACECSTGLDEPPCLNGVVEAGVGLVGSKVITIEREEVVPGTTLRRKARRTIRVSSGNSFGEVASLIFDLYPDTSKVFCIVDRSNTVFLSSLHKPSYSYRRLANGATYKLQDYEGTAPLKTGSLSSSRS